MKPAVLTTHRSKKVVKALRPESQCGVQRTGIGGRNVDSGGAGGSGAADDAGAGPGGVGGSGATDDDWKAGCGGGTGLRAVVAAAGGSADIRRRMSCPAVCSLAMSRAICSWPAASCSTLCRTAARSCAIVASCCDSGAVGAVDAAVSDAVGAGATICPDATCGMVAACGADAATAGGLGCSTAISRPDGGSMAGGDNNQLSCGAALAIICLAVSP
jgi:hypothetical protein